MFDGFEQVRVPTGEATINAVHGGTGPPVLLVHGFPESSAMWTGIAPALAETHTVVVADLRGYGESSVPGAGDDHGGYSFRSMAGDQLALMRTLGHERFAVVGHDRGARVAHRMALDHPDAVERVAVLDILPTRHVYGHVDQALATAYYHWFFLIQPFDLPERLIAADPIGYLHSLLGAWGGGTGHIAPDAMAGYERAFADPDRRHAMLEDYRAGASIDLAHDEADAARRVEVPLLALWGTRSVVGASPIDPLDVWRGYGGDVRGATVDAGHFLVEERPKDVLEVLRGFLTVTTIRAAVTDDDAGVVAVDDATWSTLNSPSPKPEGPRSYFERAAVQNVIVAVDGDRVVGYTQVRRKYPMDGQAHVIEINGLAVHPDATGRGLGARLVEAAVAEAGRRGARKVTLRVLGTNEVARRLYLRCGFVEEAVLRAEFLLDGRYVDDVQMARFVDR